MVKKPDWTQKQHVRRLGYDSATLTGHGFWHMASTLLNERGFNGDAIERQLSHKQPCVRGTYNQAEHLAERARMQAWADYLDRLLVCTKTPPLPTVPAPVAAGPRNRDRMAMALDRPCRYRSRPPQFRVALENGG